MLSFCRKFLEIIRQECCISTYLKHILANLKVLMKKLFVFPLFLLSTVSFPQSFDLQGNRGCRGMMPENTIPGFLLAADLGVQTIQLDVVVSSDKKCVVSHEPFFNSKFSRKPDSTQVLISEEDSLNIFEMDYAEIEKYDVGILGNPDFPGQEKISAVKPLLIDAINQIENHIRSKSLAKITYNIELKSDPEYDGKFNPSPKEFVSLVYHELLNLDVLDRVTISSFDQRILQEMKELDGSIKLSLLVSNIDGVEKNLKRLGFTPDTYSIYFRLLNEGMMREIRRNGMKVIVWTVNDEADYQHMIKLGVDGIITDFPDRFTGK